MTANGAFLLCESIFEDVEKAKKQCSACAQPKSGSMSTISMSTPVQPCEAFRYEGCLVSKADNSEAI